MAENETTEKLTACKDCCWCESPPESIRVCGCPNAPLHFDSYHGIQRVMRTQVASCIQINTDGHCPHFEANK